MTNVLSLYELFIQKCLLFRFITTLLDSSVSLGLFRALAGAEAVIASCCVFSGAVLQGAVLSRVKGEERLCVCTELPWGTGSRQ